MAPIEKTGWIIISKRNNQNNAMSARVSNAFILREDAVQSSSLYGDDFICIKQITWQE